jgi:hypothetical protein
VQIQGEDSSSAAVSRQHEELEFGDIESQSDFFGVLWDMSNDTSTNIDLSIPPSITSDICHVPSICHRRSDSTPLIDGDNDWEPVSFDSPDPVSKFEWLSHYSTARGLSCKFNHTKSILSQETAEGHNAIKQGISGFNETITNFQCGSKRLSELNAIHRFESEWALESETPSNGNSSQCQWYSDPLALKTNEIVVRIKEAVQMKPRNSIISFDWSPLLESMCVSFFNPLNIRRLIDLFWSGWYPHWPVIHRPTFDPSSTPVTLLASMMLIGACTSTNISDHRNANVWGNSVEEMVFTDEYFCGNIIVFAEKSHTGRRRLQALQAAHAICLDQYYEGDDVSKRRVRTYRYGAEVVVSYVDILFVPEKN